MGQHSECPGCEKVVLEDELCGECGLCSRCCDCVDDDDEEEEGDDDADVPL